MFFEISKNSNTQFTKNYEIKKEIFFNCDLGWSEISVEKHKVFFKGYINEKEDLNEILKKIILDPTPKYQGNFFCIIIDESKIIITNSYSRGSGLSYIKNKLITNLYITDTPIWSDKFVTIDNNFNFSENKFKSYNVNINDIDKNSAIKLIHENICESFENFLQKNKNPIKIFLSGGIDTLTCYSYLKKFTKNFELVDYEYIKFTHFYKNNIDFLKNFWGYKQIHSWGETPTALVSGGCGDEFFMRGPSTCNLLLLHYKINIFKILEKNKNYYHYWYFMKKNKKILEDQKNDKNLINNILNDKFKTFNHILNTLINDHQHWHIDETICFTPFKDIRIPEIMLRLGKKDIEGQVCNADINRELIIKNNPDDLKLLSTQKNFSRFENL